MSNNHLYTLGYFRKRLIEAGITSKILVSKYAESDCRYWTISIGNDKHIFCTCYKNDFDVMFEFWDGRQRIQHLYLMQTQSMNVIIAQIFRWFESSLSDK